MEKSKFIAACQAAYGESFVTPVSQHLGVSDRTVRHWVAGKYRLPSLIAADVSLMLLQRKSEIEEALKMTTEKFLMNPLTGSVDTEENWLSEMSEWAVDPELSEEDAKLVRRLQFDRLIEVTKNENGEWVETQ